MNIYLSSIPKVKYWPLEAKIALLNAYIFGIIPSSSYLIWKLLSIARYSTNNSKLCEIFNNVKTVVNLFQHFLSTKPKNKTQPINKTIHLIAEKIEGIGNMMT